MKNYLIENHLVEKLLVLFILFFTANAFAIDIIPSNSNYYYQLGGGSDISMPPVTEQQDITIGGDINTDLGFTCTGFNPAISIANTLNNIRDSVEGLQQSVIDSATSAIGSLPMYMLEKASPELYNLIQNTLTHAQERFHLSMKSCQTALSEIKSGKSPYQDWFSISDSQGWLKETKSAATSDINFAAKRIADNPKQYGIPWVHKGKNSGGTQQGQVPIRVIYDVVVAGYNALLDSSRSLDSLDPAPQKSTLARFWKTPDEAGKWSQLVLGDITISATVDQKTHAGIGLTTIMQTCPAAANNSLTCAKNISKKLANIVASGSYPDAETLKAVSSNEMLITPQVISAIRKMNEENQTIAISKISEDAALQNLIDEALLLRRILIAGSQTKPVHNLKPALVTVRQTISDLDQDIQSVMFEHNVRKQLMANTLQTVLSFESSSKALAESQQNITKQPVLEQGAVYSK